MIDGDALGPAGFKIRQVRKVYTIFVLMIHAQPAFCGYCPKYRSISEGEELDRKVLSFGHCPIT